MAISATVEAAAEFGEWIGNQAVYIFSAPDGERQIKAAFIVGLPLFLFPEPFTTMVGAALMVFGIVVGGLRILVPPFDSAYPAG